MNNQRNIKFIVVHCTATPANISLESIKRFWEEQRGWGGTPGYHYFIKRDGTIVQLLDEKEETVTEYISTIQNASASLISEVSIKTENQLTTEAIHKSMLCSTRSWSSLNVILKPKYWDTGILLE